MSDKRKSKLDSEEAELNSLTDVERSMIEYYFPVGDYMATGRRTSRQKKTGPWGTILSLENNVAEFFCILIIKAQCKRIINFIACFGRTFKS